MTTDFEKQGKKNRREGGDFERKVRAWLEEDWVVDKFSSNVDLEEGVFVKAKQKFNPFSKALGIGTGFPDFVCLKPSPEGKPHELMFVECKLNGKLSREEKEKMAWMEGEGYCCWVAGQDEDGDVELNKPKKTREAKKAESGK